jgi:Co/Zn/Cd efflux system component
LRAQPLLTKSCTAVTGETRVRLSALSSPRFGRSGHDGNMHGVFLHVFADACTQLGLISATWLVRWK